MGRIDEGIIDKIREGADIVEIASGYMNLKKAGRNYRALCPFHTEKTPSFMVSSEKQIFHCFGCGVGGNVFNLVMKMENVDFAEAVKLLGQKIGISVAFSEEESRDAREKDAILEANQIAAEIYHSFLWKKEYERALQYLKKRDLSEDIIKKFKLGYAPGEGLLFGELKRRGVSPEVMRRAGLISASGRQRDYFHRRIIFPIFNLQQGVAGFGGRILDGGEPKYLNTPETPVFNKRRILYGLNFTREGIRKTGEVIIVEGYMDFLALFQNGIDNAVASMGTSLTESQKGQNGREDPNFQISLIKRYTERPILCYDADSAGQGATMRGLDLFIEKELEPRIMVLPSGDPDSFIREKGKKAFLKMATEALPLMEYHFHRVFSDCDRKTEEGKSRIAREMLDIIDKIKDNIKKGAYLKRLAEELQVDERRVRGEYELQLRKYAKRRSSGKRGQTVPVFGQEEGYAECLLIRSMLQDNSVIQIVRDTLNLEDFQSSKYRKIVKEIFGIFGKSGKADPGVLMDRLEEEGLVSEISAFSLGEERDETAGDKQKIVNDCIRKIKECSIVRRKRIIDMEIKKAEDEGKIEESNSLMSQYQKLEKCIREGC